MIIAEQVEHIERSALAGVWHAKDIVGRLSILAAHCPSPLWRFFTDRNRQVLALALDAVLTGACQPDRAAAVEWLASLPIATANETLAGRQPRASESVTYEHSALAWIGGYLGPDTAIGDVLPPSDAGHAAACLSLRRAHDRRAAEAALRTLADRIARTTLQDGCAGAIAAGLDEVGAIVGDHRAANLGDHLDHALTQAQERSRHHDTTCATWGLPELDAACPLRPGRLYVLAAPPGTGKTSLALQAATATAPDGGSATAAIVSLEMPGDELALIVAGRLLGIAPAAIRERAASLSAEQWTALHALRDAWRTAATIWIRDIGEQDRAEITPADVLAWATERSRAARGTLGLVVVDYCQLLAHADPRATEYVRVSAASRAMKRLAMALHVPVILLSQLNREGRKAGRDRDGALAAIPEPRLEDLRGSGSLEQDADAVLFVHRADPNPAPVHASSIIVAKHRMGACGRIDVRFYGRHQFFASEPSPASASPRACRMASDPSPSEEVF